MAQRTVIDALAALDSVPFHNSATERDFTQTVVRTVRDAVTSHADFAATQAQEHVERYKEITTELNDVANSMDHLAGLAADPLTDRAWLAQRWGWLNGRLNVVAQVVDEPTKDGDLAMRQNVITLLTKLENPLVSLDSLQRKYPTLQRHWDH